MAIGTPSYMLERLVKDHSQIAILCGRYREATKAVLDWYATGRPASKADRELLGSYAGDAARAIYDLEAVVVELATDLRAAHAATMPVQDAMPGARPMPS